MLPRRMRRGSAQFRAWLFDGALPLWWRVGADHARGGYHERIDFYGRPDLAAAIARRRPAAFCYCEAGRLGWNGPWREAGRACAQFFAPTICAGRTAP